METPKTVFVTYAWINEKEDRRVIDFVNILRKNGYDATCDRFEMDGKTAPNFTDIMTKGLNYDKVIVLLSNAYYRKAIKGGTGVNTEYSVIANRIRSDKYANKYVLAMLDTPSEEETIPTLFEGLYYIDLEDDYSVDDGYPKLFAKLNDEPLYEKAPLGNKVPVVKPYFRSIITFYIDGETVLIDKESKNRLREAVNDIDYEFEIEIFDVALYTCKKYLEQYRDKMAQGEDLTDKEEMIYQNFIRFVKSKKERLRKITEAIESYIRHNTLYSFWVTNLNRHIDVISNFILLCDNKNNFSDRRYGMVEGMWRNSKSGVCFKANVNNDKIDESATDMLRYACGDISSFAVEDIVQSIIPGLYFGIYFYLSDDKRKEFDKEENIYDLGNYRFGWA